MRTQLDEIGAKMKKVTAKTRENSAKIQAEYSCENPQLLEAVFCHFLENLAVNFDEIFRMLADDLIQEEIPELNRIERLK